MRKGSLLLWEVAKGLVETESVFDCGFFGCNPETQVAPENGECADRIRCSNCALAERFVDRGNGPIAICREAFDKWPAHNVLYEAFSDGGGQIKSSAIMNSRQRIRDALSDCSEDQTQINLIRQYVVIAPDSQNSHPALRIRFERKTEPQLLLNVCKSDFEIFTPYDRGQIAVVQLFDSSTSVEKSDIGITFETTSSIDMAKLPSIQKLDKSFRSETGLICERVICDRSEIQIFNEMREFSNPPATLIATNARKAAMEIERCKQEATSSTEGKMDDDSSFKDLDIGSGSSQRGNEEVVEDMALSEADDDSEDNEGEEDDAGLEFDD